MYRYTPTSGFATPYLPWIPAGGVMMNCFLLGTLTQISFLFWGVWMILSIILYLCYGVWKRGIYSYGYMVRSLLAFPFLG